MLDYYERNFGLTKKLPQTGSFFFDVGANEGSWTLTLAPGYGEVHAFEPDTRALLQLYRHIESEKLTNVRVHGVALAAHSGTLMLQQYKTSEHTGVVAGRNIPDPNLGDIIKTFDAPCLTLDLHIDMYGLDKFDLSASAVKIDVEGAELAVLVGANKLLTGYYPALLVEIHSNELKTECISYLTSLGYDCEVIRHPDYKPKDPRYDNHLWLNCRKKD